jgi:hypothetical protein
MVLVTEIIVAGLYVLVSYVRICLYIRKTSPFFSPPPLASLGWSDRSQRTGPVASSPHPPPRLHQCSLSGRMHRLQRCRLRIRRVLIDSPEEPIPDIDGHLLAQWPALGVVSPPVNTQEDTTTTVLVDCVSPTRNLGAGLGPGVFPRSPLNSEGSTFMNTAIANRNEHYRLSSYTGKANTGRITQ